MSTIKEYIWNGSGYVELDAGTVDGRDSLEFETADPEIQNHIKTPHASVATVNSNRADIDVIKNSGYLKGVNGIEFEDFNPVNAQFLEGNPASYFAKQSDLDINTSAIGQMEKSYSQAFTRSTNLTGQQIIDIGFNPRVIMVQAYLKNAANSNYASIGSMSVKSNKQSRISQYGTGSWTVFQGTLIFLHSAYGYNVAVCRANGDNTITLDWTKAGTDLPSDDIVFILTAF